MTITQGPTPIHWNYFLTLDSDTANLSRYIDFVEDNFEAYSTEMARILLTAASEVDVVAKLLCQRINQNSNASNINDYRNEITTAIPVFANMEINIPRYALTFHPWDNWLNSVNPDWWSGYNAVKHERNANFRLANLKNTLNSVGALLVMLLHYYRDEARNGDLIPSPSLFSLGENHIRGFGQKGAALAVLYDV